MLTAYSDRMKKLLADPAAYYTPKKRPSGHDIGTTFAKDNGGAIPPNLLQIPNSESNGAYLRGCKAIKLGAHPARFPAKLPEFFIRFLTDPDDLVVDIFAGSNTTGAVAEEEGRHWLSFDNRLDYLAASAFRFFGETATDAELRKAYERIMAGQSLSFSVPVYAHAGESGSGDTLYAQKETQALLLLHEAPAKPAKAKAKGKLRKAG